MAGPFRNSRLFSDHFLEEVVPTLELWTAVDDAELRAVQTELRRLYAEVNTLVGGHEGQTEEHWIRPVLRRLGFHFQVFPSVSTAEGVRWPDYALFATGESRALSEDDARTQAYFNRALAIADAKVWNRSLDRRVDPLDPGDRRNPAAQIDAYLRETDRYWAILTNGRQWRLYARATSYRLDTYYEVDLLEHLDASVDDFKYFWLLFRREAFEHQPDSLLDDLLSGSTQFAERLTSRVKERVYEAVREFANGFYANTANQLDPYRDTQAAFQASLILLYRLLFALYAESRSLLPLDSTGYRSTYSLTAIKENLADRLDATMSLLPNGTSYYGQLQNLFRLIARGSDALGVAKYNGGLFDDARHPFLGLHQVGDLHLARGLDLLTRIPGADDQPVFVDYRSLDVRHLGDIYEGLLEYHARYAEEDMVAVLENDVEVWRPAAGIGAATIRDRAPAGTVYLATGKGERRSTGSYYTPQHVVAYMVERSIGTRIAELAERHHGDALVEAVLSLKVCDPAMGSGHFLVESVDYIARRLVELGASAPEEVDETELATWRRRVVERCVYGVDQNPLAVELAKLSLWLATVSLGRPLSFLDNHLVHGDSLLGARIADLRVLSGDNQGDVFADRLGQVLPKVREELRRIASEVSETLEDVQAKEALLGEARRLLSPFKIVADTWLAARFGAPVTPELYGKILQELDRPRRLSALTQRELGYVAHVRDEFAFFHWELEFPEVFASAGGEDGFDVLITNPPYVNANELNDSLSQYEKPFWRTRFNSAAGAYDLYVLFIELCLRLCRTGGYATLITPNKYLAAPYAKALREYLSNTHCLLEILDASHLQVFDDPRVYPVVSVFVARTEQGSCPVEIRRLEDENSWTTLGTHPAEYLRLLPEYIWAFLLRDDAELLVSIAERSMPTVDHPRLEPVASTTVAEAGVFAEALHELHHAPSPGWKVVNTGTIEPFSSAWGLERLLNSRRTYLRPVLPRNTSVVGERRRNQYRSSKLIFSKLCKHLTAAIDAEGEFAAINVNFVITDSEAVSLYGAVFNSALMRWIYEGYFGALRMSGGYMQVQAPQLRVLPLPRLFASEGDGDTEDVRHLRALATERHETETERMSQRIALVSELIDALAVAARREEEPSWVMPRQAAILASIEDTTAQDLSEFWRVLRRTAAQLGVDITPAREECILSVVQRFSPVLRQLTLAAAELDSRIDDVVFRLYDLNSDEVAHVRRTVTAQ